MAAVREVRNTWQKQPSRLEVRVEGGGGVAPGARAEILPQPVGKIRVRQAVPLQPTENHRGPETHLQPVEKSALKQVDVF